MQTCPKEKSNIAAHFNAAAATYQTQPGVQREVAEEVADLVLSDGRNPGGVLEVGCGTGFLTRLLCRKLSRASFTCTDIAPSMLAQARQNLAGQNGRIRWHAADVADLSLPDQYDLAVSSSALHWAQPLENAFAAIHSHLKPGARLVFGLMTDQTLRELHDIRQKVAPHKPLGLSLPTPRAVLDVLEMCGFRIESEQVKRHKAWHASAKAFLKALHKQGVTGGSGGHVLNRSELLKLMREYETACADAEHGVYASYEVLYVKARRDR